MKFLSHQLRHHRRRTSSENPSAEAFPKLESSLSEELEAYLRDNPIQRVHQQALASPVSSLSSITIDLPLDQSEDRTAVSPIRPRSQSPWLTSSDTSEEAFGRHISSPQLTPPTLTSTLPMMAAFRADFKFCGYYNGKDMPAAKWLKKLDWELEGYMVDHQIPPHRYIQAFELLLTEDASAWAETHPQAVQILSLDEPTYDAVRAFKSLLCARFPMKSAEVSSISFDTELSELKQQDESLAAYYKRLTVLMQHVGARDRPSHPSDADPPLTMLEAAMLESIMKAFLRGLSDSDVRREATRGLASPTRSLLGVYNLADEARRTKSAVEKLNEEEHKARENEILRSLVQKTMSKEQLDSLVSSFQTNAGSPKVQPQWSLEGLSKLLDKLNQSNGNSNPPSTAHYPGNYYPDQSPSDRYERAPYIAQNPNRRNGTGPDLRKPSTGTYRSTPRDLPDKSRSQNPFINGAKSYSMRGDGPMCVRCGEMNAKKDDGHKCQPLPAWEQSYLKEVVFGTPAQSNFAAAGFGEYDGRVYPWSRPTLDGSDSSSSAPMRTPSSGSSTSNSVTIGVSEVYRQPQAQAPQQSNSVEVLYDQTSGPNKRPRVEEINEDLVTPTVPANTNPPQTGMNQPPPGLVQETPQQPPITFQGADTRPKGKGKKRVGKRIELQPLVGLFNEGSGSFDAPVSVRAMLQRTKVDMTWMDLVAWSPAIGRELKRLCTRVTKKREKKAPKQRQVQFNPMLQQPYMNIPAWVQPPVVPQMFQPQPLAPQQPQASQQSTLPQTNNPWADPNSQATLGGASHAVLVQPDAHTRLLAKLAGSEKAFRIPATVKSGDGSEIRLEKKETHADQGSEMNVISTAMVKKIKAQLRPLSEVGFQGLTMETADHFESTLDSYVGFDLCVEGIWRFVRCFVAPQVRGRSDETRILLGLPWQYSVDAFISVRRSTIQIGDSSIGETPRYITGPELVYHKDHNMILYPKAIIGPAEAFRKPTFESESDDSSDESEDDLSDIDEGF